MNKPVSLALSTMRGPHGHRPLRTLALALGCVLACAVGVSAARAAAPRAQEAAQPARVADEPTEPTDTVSVAPEVADWEIRERLTRILDASGWFEGVDVSVAEGVVVLSGTTVANEHRAWATAVASRIEGVVGVANRMEVEHAIDWSLAPAWEAVREVVREGMRRLPLFAIGLVLVLAGLVVGRLASAALRPALTKRLENALLVQVASTLVVLAFVVLGVYLFLNVSGLTRLAATVLGGTGLLGLILGIAFRDIAENFLASLLISAKRPFRPGDLVPIGDVKGYVENVTTRGTLLTTVEGNYIHVPNSKVYKSTVVNYNANPSTRYDFTIGIDYGDSIEEAQAVCLRVLQEHEHVLAEPEPLVLVTELGGSAVVLRVYYWLDVNRSNQIKVHSSLLRLTKSAVVAAGMSMPDDAREVIFPRGVPLHRVDDAPAPASTAAPQRARAPAPVSQETSAEGSSESEAVEVRRQAKGAADLDLGEMLVDRE